MRSLPEDLYPLSPMQEGLLFHSLESPGSGIHITQHAWILRHLDVGAFTRAWQWVADRHTILRTAFVWRNTSKPLQAVLARVDVPIAREDWRGLGEEEQAARRRACLETDRHRDFNLNRAPLFRLALIALDDERHQVILTQHHLLLDGWSLPLLFRDVAMAYREYTHGGTPSAARPHAFSEYVRWLQRQDLERADRFWRGMLGDYRGLPSSSRTQADRGGVTEQRLRISDRDTGRLREWCRRHQITVNTACQGAWALVLGRLRESDDVVFGAIVSGRPTELPGIETMLGLFINTIPVRARLSSTDSVASWLRDLQARHSEASQYAYTPLPQIKQCSRVPSKEPLFDTAINFLNYPRLERGEGDHLDVPQVEDALYSTSNAYRFSLLVGADGDGLSMTMLSEPGCFPAAAMQRVGPMLESVLTSFAHSGDAPVADLQQTLTDVTRRVLASQRSAGFREFRTVRPQSSPVLAAAPR